MASTKLIKNVNLKVVQWVLFIVITDNIFTLGLRVQFEINLTLCIITNKHPPKKPLQLM
jgi:hypothetical protein